MTYRMQNKYLDVWSFNFFFHYLFLRGGGISLIKTHIGSPQYQLAAV